MNEHSYIRAVTRHLPKDKYKWKINDNYAGGVPDWFFEGEAKDLWVEWKYIKVFPKRPQTMIDLTSKKYLSTQQQRWLERRNRIRGDAWVIAGSEHGGVVFRGLEWKNSISAEAFLSKCLSHKELCSLILQNTV